MVKLSLCQQFQSCLIIFTSVMLNCHWKILINPAIELAIEGHSANWATENIRASNTRD